MKAGKCDAALYLSTVLDERGWNARKLVANCKREKNGIWQVDIFLTALPNCMYTVLYFK